MEAFSHVVKLHFEGIILFVLTLDLLGLISANIRDHEGTSSVRIPHAGQLTQDVIKSDRSNS